MKYILVLLMLGSLAACGPAEELVPNNGNNSSFGDANGTDVVETNYNVCGSFTPPGLSITSNGWGMQVRTDNGFRILTALYVNDEAAFFRNTCSVNGRSLSAAVRVPARYTNNSLDIQCYGEKTEKINETDFKMNCSIRVDSSWMNYGFRGRCLELSRPGYSQKILMVPL